MKTRSLKAVQHAQYKLPEQVFDAFNKDLPIQEALGSNRTQAKREAADIRSVNWVPNVSGWRLTPRGLELGATTDVFPAGSITLASLQNISTDKILGRDTAGSGVIEQLGLGAGLSISGGNLVNTVSAYTTEEAQDAVGSILADDGDIDFTYDDATPKITASVKTGTAVRYTLFCTAATFSPADATDYYFGGRYSVAPQAVGVKEAQAIVIPKTGTLKAASMMMVQTVDGSSETSTMYFRLNDTTDTALFSAIDNSIAFTTPNKYLTTGLAVAVTAGDYFELKWTTPTWATNPTGVFMMVTLYFE